MIPENVKALFDKTENVAFATCANNVPNVVAIYWKKIEGDCVWLADNFMRKTLDNVKANPHGAVSFWDDKTGEGYQLKGKLNYYAGGDKLKKMTDFIHSRNPNRTPKGLVELVVEEAYVITPGPDAGKKLV